MSAPTSGPCVFCGEETSNRIEGGGRGSSGWYAWTCEDEEACSRRRELERRGREMTLWLLRPRAPFGHDPWDPPADCVFGLVVRSWSEENARFMAQGVAGAESRPGGREVEPVWLNPRLTTCIELESEGERQVIIIDRRVAQWHGRDAS